MVHPTQQRRPQKARKAVSSIVLISGQRVRTIRISPLIAGCLVGVLGVFVTAYIGATAYLIYRDDLLGATVARQVSLQYDYEERIAALRSELDRVTSRQMVETQDVEGQVSSLLERQAELDRRRSILEGLIARARESGIKLASATAPVPRQRPALDEIAPPNSSAGLGYVAQPASEDVISETLFQETGSLVEGKAPDDLRPQLFELHSSIESYDKVQSAALDALMAASQDESRKLASVLGKVGVAVPASAAQGGPYIPADAHFVEKSASLEKRLMEVAELKASAARLPLKSPISGARLSSGFGTRPDPFIGRPALHAGLDFAAPAGAPVRATAAGTVVSAGWSGGYGNLVEIRHASGLTTRFGHLSRISVREGQKVVTGTKLGEVGSTGRSTGPHLHYETRKKGKPVDPAIYLAAGKLL